MAMQMRKYKALCFGSEVDAYEIKVSRDEYEMLREFLLNVGVVLDWSVSDCKEYTCYVRNPWKDACLYDIDGRVTKEARRMQDGYENGRY